MNLKKLIVTVSILGVFAGVAAAQVAQMPFRPFYWIIGTVVDSGEVKADGRTVVFYKDDDTYNTNNAQAVISNNKFILNAFNIYPLSLTVGETYKVSIVKGDDGYGMNPVSITISGKGYEEISGSGKVDASDFADVGVDPGKIWQDLIDAGIIDENGNITSKFDGSLDGSDLSGYTDDQLKKISDILNNKKDGFSLKKDEGTTTPPAPSEELQPEPAPNVKFWFGNRLYQKEQVAKGRKFIVSSTPEIKIEVSLDSPYTISNNLNDYSLTLDPGTTSSKTFTLGVQHISSKVLATEAGAEDKLRAFTLTYSVSEPFSEGEHTLQVSAKSSGALGIASTKTEITTLEVLGGPLRVLGTPITYPSPFSITRDKTVYVQYELSANANIDLYLIGVSGERFKKFTCNAGTEGGSAGLNKVSWSGVTDQGYLAGNAIYVGTIIARDEGKLLGKFKLTIVD